MAYRSFSLHNYSIVSRTLVKLELKSWHFTQNYVDIEDLYNCICLNPLSANELILTYAKTQKPLPQVKWCHEKHQHFHIYFHQNPDT